MGTVPHFDPCFLKRFVPRCENMKDMNPLDFFREEAHEFRAVKFPPMSTTIPRLMAVCAGLFWMCLVTCRNTKAW